MKGVVFNLLEEVVTSEHGEDTWDALLEDAGVEGAYTSLGNYPDSDLARLVTSASGTLGVAPDDIVRWFGRSALPLFARAYPHFFEPHEATREFVLTLNEIIHPEVRKLYPGADVPEFGFDVDEGDTGGALAMTYRSRRQMCAFAEGLIEGAGDHYGEQATIAQPQCMKRGDEHCLLQMSFAPTA